MQKLVNPLDYPIAILIGGLCLIVGVRFLGIPNPIILPTAAVVATGSAIFLKSRSLNPEKVAQQQIKKELQSLKLLAQELVSKSNILLEEANQALSSEDFQLELLVAVQSVCNNLAELPKKIEQLGQKIFTRSSLLSSEDLEQQLQAVQKKIPLSSGIAKEQLEQLANQLEQNIKLTKIGQDTQQAQILNLHNLVQSSAGVLQELQNKLRTANLKNSQDIQELQKLSQELNQIQDNVNILVI